MCIIMLYVTDALSKKSNCYQIILLMSKQKIEKLKIYGQLRYMNYIPIMIKSYK